MIRFSFASFGVPFLAVLAFIPWSLSGIAVAQVVLPELPKPSPEADAANTLWREDRHQEACAAFLGQVGSDSRDPWSFRGAALCALQSKADESRFLASLRSRPEDPQTWLAWGYWHLLHSETGKARALLRRAVEADPEMALAWEAISLPVPTSLAPDAVSSNRAALDLIIELRGLRNEIRQTRLYEEVFERLIRLLQELPERWSSVPQPLVPLSGRSPDEVIESASNESRGEKLARFAALSQEPPPNRGQKLRQIVDSRSLSEIDLWLPQMLAIDTPERDPRDLAATLEAWLQFAEAVGRKDVLFVAAAQSFDLLSRQLGQATILHAAALWADLETIEKAERGQGQVVLAYAEALASSGRHPESAEACKRAYRLFERVRFPQGQAVSLLGEGRANLKSGRLEEALAAFRRSRSIFESPGTAPARQGVAQTWFGEGEAQARLARNSFALDAYRNARSLFEEAGDEKGLAYTWIGEGEVLTVLGRTAEASAAFSKGQGLAEAAADGAVQARCWLSMGSLKVVLDDIPAALEAFRRPRLLFDDADALPPSAQADTWLAEGHAHELQGDPQQAIQAYRRAKGLSEQVGDPLGQGNAWLGEGRIHLFSGEYEDALAAFRRARSLYQKARDPRGQANVHREEGDLLFRLGDKRGAEDAYLRALAIFEAVEDPLGQANSLIGCARLMSAQGENFGALGASFAARFLFESAGNRRGMAASFLIGGDALAALGLPQPALLAYGLAEQLFQEVEDRLGQAHAWMGQALVLLNEGTWRGAAAAAENAASLYGGIGMHDSRVAALTIQADARSSAGESEAAISLAEEAIKLHDQVRQNFITDRLRTREDQMIAVPYDILVGIHAGRRDSVKEALTLAEAARSRVLLDLLASGPQIPQSTKDFALTGQRESLTEQLARLQRMISQASTPSRRRELEAIWDELERRRRWVLYESIASSQGSFPGAEPLNADAIQELAAATGPILLFYAAPRRLYGFLMLGRGRPILRTVEIGLDRLQSEVDQLRLALANPLREAESLNRRRAMWNLLIAPFLPKLPQGGPLVLIPHGPLHQLPFEALLDPDQVPLFERWEVALEPSATALRLCRLRHDPPKREDAFLALASGSGLRLLKREMDEIAGLFGRSSRLAPIQAGYEDYERQAPHAKQILIATRGVHVQDSRSRTYLEIQPGPKHGSWLSASEIGSIELQAELVTLAACDTAAGKALFSDERLDLTRAFLIAGAASVLATRWKVPEDQSTIRFLLDFYRAYRQGGPDGQGIRKDEALNVARRKSQERGDSAQVWAAWVLVGDAR